MDSHFPIKGKREYEGASGVEFIIRREQAFGLDFIKSGFVTLYFGDLFQLLSRFAAHTLVVFDWRGVALVEVRSISGSLSSYKLDLDSAHPLRLVSTLVYCFTEALSGLFQKKALL
ncbi:hypothetical protein Ccrd_012287 [Cynara cardunculus var. scolymus]|uniref:Uncharacterized protein n=1 Tax=Cynara cardunculus var. scolymus TaxID=59895 RepID=A0A103YHT5_CYNCS|nr:hypothetical protein Ccrd_012287 [Cynara cardunculus var. scolymus]